MDIILILNNIYYIIKNYLLYLYNLIFYKLNKDKIKDLHIAIIPDGNRRFYNNFIFYKDKKFRGYKMAINKIINISTYFFKNFENKNIHLSFFLFSIDNFKRAENEGLNFFKVFCKVFGKILIEKQIKYKINIKFIILDKKNVPEEILDLNKKLEKKKFKNKNYLYFYCAYSSMDELVHVINNKLYNKKVNKDIIRDNLIINKPVDILIRTSGTRRLSSFLTLQSEYAELFFNNKLFPLFNNSDLYNILIDYTNIKRNFGK